MNMRKIDRLDRENFCQACGNWAIKGYAIEIEYLIYPIRVCEKCMQTLQLNDFDVEKQRYQLKVKELEKKTFDLEFELRQLKTHLYRYSDLIEYAKEQKQKNILVNDTIDRFISDLTKEIKMMEGKSDE
jgi:hypothetical protein